MGSKIVILCISENIFAVFRPYFGYQNGSRAFFEVPAACFGVPAAVLKGACSGFGGHLQLVLGHALEVLGGTRGVAVACFGVPAAWREWLLSVT